MKEDEKYVVVKVNIPAAIKLQFHETNFFNSLFPNGT